MRLLLASIFAGFFMSAAQAHDEYTNWKQPHTGVSCCSERDCYATEAQFKDGTWYARRREDGKWLAVPPEVVLDERPADGSAHVCAPAPIYSASTVTVWCFVPPNNGS